MPANSPPQAGLRRLASWLSIELVLSADRDRRDRIVDLAKRSRQNFAGAAVARLGETYPNLSRHPAPQPRSPVMEGWV